MDLLAHSLYRLSARCNLRDADVILLQESFDVNRRSILPPKWLPDRKDAWPLHLATFYATPDESRVAQDRRDVKDGRKSPARQHLLELRGDLLGGNFLRMEQSWRENVHVAVPEAGSDNQAFAVNDRRTTRDSDRSAWSDGDNPAVVHRSEEHTSELQSLRHLVCRLL